MPAAPKRADAARNREKLLTAARAAFAAGEALSMAELARRAGVGMATLYRNFPGRRDLLEALYTDEVEALCAAAEDAALDDWLRRFFAFFHSKRHVAAELLAESDDRDVFDSGRARVLAAGRPLLAAAQDAGRVREDLTLEQILDMVVAIAKVPGDPAYVEPILQAALDGLRAQASLGSSRSGR